MRNLRVAVLLSGGGTTLQNLIERSKIGVLPITIELVVSSRFDAGGLLRAQQAGIETAVVASASYREGGATDWVKMAAALNALLLPRNFDLILLAGFMCFYCLPPELEGKVLNIHPALLPAFGGRGMWGARVHAAVKKAGVKISGCTVHFVTNAYDSGPIIVQKSCPLTAEDRVEEIAAKVFRLECEAYPEAIGLFAQARLTIVGGVVRIKS